MRDDLPSGTVTFLFTDVEGSTRLLHELGAEAYAGALAEHRHVVREACAAEGGVEVDTQGDAFFFAFPTAAGAVASAHAITEALAAGPIHLRIGVHTGAPLVTDEGYVGDDVHLAARVAASGHGGQVVLSQSTGALFGSHTLTDLGEHRLKDIEGAVSIFQLGSTSFPPLKTISNTNLPRPASSFVGRAAELADVLSLIKRGARLLTLTGPGGSGKTRLALEVAATLVPAYRAGVFWIGLASLRNASLVGETIAQTLGAKGRPGRAHRTAGAAAPSRQPRARDRGRRQSFPLSSPPVLPDPARHQPRASARSGRGRVPVPSARLAEAVSALLRAPRLEPSEEIARICRSLDDLPLAVELAAARTKALSPAQILERLAERLDLLKGGRDADPRQQTLRATIGWSYDLLPAEERELFARLAVFDGGCTLEAAEEVARAPISTRWRRCSTRASYAAQTSVWMLETIREFAGELLERRTDVGAVRDRHANLYLALVEEAHSDTSDLSRSHLVSRLERELPNVRASLSWFFISERPTEELRLLRALSKFWLSRDHLAEGESLLEEALARIPDDGFPASSTS